MVIILGSLYIPSIPLVVGGGPTQSIGLHSRRPSASSCLAGTMSEGIPPKPGQDFMTIKGCKPKKSKSTYPPRAPFRLLFDSVHPRSKSLPALSLELHKPTGLPEP